MKKFTGREFGFKTITESGSLSEEQMKSILANPTPQEQGAEVVSFELKPYQEVLFKAVQEGTRLQAWR